VWRLSVECLITVPLAVHRQASHHRFECGWYIRFLAAQSVGRVPTNNRITELSNQPLDGCGDVY
jgi:hypothetical protein